MLRELKSEFRKLLSVRSTYVISAVALALTGFISLVAMGVQSDGVFAPNGLQRAVLDIIPIMGTFVGIIAILLIGHEYRYNTIYYTLTSTNQRVKVLAAKLAATGLFGIVFALITIVWTLAMVSLGLKWGGHYIGPQDFEVGSVLWKSLAYMVSTAWFGLLLGFVSRNLTFALVAYFMLPVLEQFAIFLLKLNANYFPTNAQNNILSMGMGQGMPVEGAFTAVASLGVFGLYLLALLIASTFLFVKRDAN
jgi:ABC-type transport system involved in multi-copper enzyme maturation permease subunit